MPDDKITANDYLESLGLDTEITLENFDYAAAEKFLEEALAAIKDRDNAVKDAKAVKNTVFLILKFIKEVKGLV